MNVSVGLFFVCSWTESIIWGWGLAWLIILQFVIFEFIQVLPRQNGDGFGCIQLNCGSDKMRHVMTSPSAPENINCPNNKNRPLVNDFKWCSAACFDPILPPYFCRFLSVSFHCVCPPVWACVWVRPADLLIMTAGCIWMIHSWILMRHAADVLEEPSCAL